VKICDEVENGHDCMTSQCSVFLHAKMRCFFMCANQQKLIISFVTKSLHFVQKIVVRHDPAIFRARKEDGVFDMLHLCQEGQ
jgi:hypothetical protein